MSVAEAARALPPEVRHAGAAPAGKRMLIAGALGNALEWYDFAVYGFLAAVFARNFFPDSDPFVGLMSAFGIFAASFLMRPVGGVVFGHIGDRMGRRRALYLSAALMTVSTVSIGVLPTYESIGPLAPALLLVLRLAQGMSIGGEYSTSSIFLAENAPARRRGAVTALTGCGVSAGTLIGSGVGALVAMSMTHDQLIAFGWRIPFLLGVLLGGFTLYLRGSAPETPAHAPEAEAPRTAGPHARLPFSRAMHEDGANMLRALGLSLSLGANFYIVFVYLTTYMHQVDGLTVRLSLQINTLSMVAVLVLGPLFAALSDRIGRKLTVGMGLTGILLCSWPMFGLMDSPDPMHVIAGQLGFAVFASAYAGPMATLLVEMFRPATRCTAFSFSYNVSLALAGGLAPMAAVYLVNREKMDMGPAWYLIAMAAISLATLLTVKDRTGQSVN